MFRDVHRLEKPQLLLPLEASFPQQTVGCTWLSFLETFSNETEARRFSTSLIFFLFWDNNSKPENLGGCSRSVLPAFLSRAIFKDAFIPCPSALHIGERVGLGSGNHRAAEDMFKWWNNPASFPAWCVRVPCIWPHQWMGWRSRVGCPQSAPRFTVRSWSLTAILY